MAVIIKEAILLIMTLITLLSALPFGPVPVFPDAVQPTEKAYYDQGEFVMNSFDLIVAPWGDDKNPGTQDAPLKTPLAAKEKLKALKGADCGTVTVWLHEGVYEFEQALVFTDKDTFDAVYRSFPGEEVVFSAGKSFTQWSQTTVNGIKAFVTDAPLTDSGDVYNAVYCGNQRLPRPVYPKSGEFTVVNALEEDAFSPQSGMFQLHAAFSVNADDLITMSNIEDVDVRILHFWCDELLPLKSVDTASGRIETRKPASMTIQKGDRYFFENVFEALSEPGEWYHSRSEGKLYYIPYPVAPRQRRPPRLTRWVSRAA